MNPRFIFLGSLGEIQRGKEVIAYRFLVKIKEAETNNLKPLSEFLFKNIQIMKSSDVTLLLLFDF
ncbi:hypothetical protein BpHYR1_009374 [Brachionus plicatilis]|uniref:Uncharacterized protein n=1 Tax=Brachionus plicatilis TaxID=10195 RepID=A0A3M7P3E0_BRAPC|nr:hypothetical protein BpHYR1_009374 [Brachionus plicatilis]